MFALDVQADGERSTRRAEISVQVSAAAAPWRKIWSSSGVQGLLAIVNAPFFVQADFREDPDLFGNRRPMLTG